MNSVERLIEYAAFEPEAAPVIPGRRPPKGWPQAGAIQVSSLVLRYSPSSDPVLRGLSFSVSGCQKVGPRDWVHGLHCVRLEVWCLSADPGLQPGAALQPGLRAPAAWAERLCEQPPGGGLRCPGLGEPSAELSCSWTGCMGECVTSLRMCHLESQPVQQFSET